MIGPENRMPDAGSRNYPRFAKAGNSMNPDKVGRGKLQKSTTGKIFWRF